MKKYIGKPTEYVALIVGNLIYALGFNLFLAQNNIAAGGFGGLGLVVNHFVPQISVGTVVLVLSIPAFIWSFCVQGVKYTLSALFSTLAFSLFTDLFAFLPNVTENKLMAAACGGITYGLAAAVLVRGRVSGSGSDLLGRLLVTKFRSISLGTVVIIIDVVVIALSVVAFKDLEGAIYAGACIVLCGYVTDAMINGFNRAYTFEIITNQDPNVIADKIWEKIDRGVTLVPVKGMYKNEERNMLMVVVSRRQIYDMKDIIREYAPDAFVTLFSTNEIMGEGFNGVDVTVPIKKLEEAENKKPEK